MPRAPSESLLGLLGAATRRQPDAPALAWKTAQWTYSDLWGAAAATAAFLQARGRNKGDHVALLFRNSPHYVAAYYGAFAAGCVTVPLNPHEHAQVLTRQMEHCQARMLLGDPAHPEWTAIAELAQSIGVEAVEVPAEDDAGALARYRRQMGGAAALHDAGAEGDALATILYTSGTPGRPERRDALAPEPRGQHDLDRPVPRPHGTGPRHRGAAVPVFLRQLRAAHAPRGRRGTAA